MPVYARVAEAKFMEISMGQFRTQLTCLARTQNEIRELFAYDGGMNDKHSFIGDTSCKCTDGYDGSILVVGRF